MFKRSLRQWCLLTCLAILGGFFGAAPSSSSVTRPLKRVGLADSGKTVSLGVGEDLVVTLPLKPFPGNEWHVAKNSDGSLKLIAGPDEKRPKDWIPGRPSLQVFYFRKESPGVAHLVLEERYFSKPMVLEVVDQ